MGTRKVTRVGIEPDRIKVLPTRGRRAVLWVGSASRDRPQKMQLRGLNGAKEKLQRVGFKLDRQRDFCVGKCAWIKGKIMLETGL